uniref:Uncharacterized protein n=1 Tax=Oryza punctata TaxID=4537 RepID=A0A0E0MH96_ORYPU
MAGLEIVRGGHLEAGWLGARCSQIHLPRDRIRHSGGVSAGVVQGRVRRCAETLWVSFPWGEVESGVVEVDMAWCMGAGAVRELHGTGFGTPWEGAAALDATLDGAPVGPKGDRGHRCKATVKRTGGLRRRGYRLSDQGGGDGGIMRWVLQASDGLRLDDSPLVASACCHKMASLGGLVRGRGDLFFSLTLSLSNPITGMVLEHAGWRAPA